MKEKVLISKSILMLLLAFVFLNLPLFFSAGSIHYWNVRILNITMFLPMIFFLLYLIKIALGSFYTLFAFIPMPIHIILRIKNEEKVLEKELSGYKEYKEKVKYRLIPMVW